jgi:hypothetical protein
MVHVVASVERISVRNGMAVIEERIMGYRPDDDPKTALLRALEKVPPSRQFANLTHALSHCDKCEKSISLDWLFCAWCGYQLMDAE